MKVEKKIEKKWFVAAIVVLITAIIALMYWTTTLPGIESKPPTTDNKIWVAIEVKPCENPWDKDVEIYGAAFTDERAIKIWLNNQGIKTTIYETRYGSLDMNCICDVKWPPKTCIERRILLLVDAFDLSGLLRLGFKRIPTNEIASPTPTYQSQ